MARRKPVLNIDDPRFLKGISHPMRVRILAMLDEGPASPKQLATRLDANLGVVAYHVRALEGFGLIKLVKTRQVRGATEHIYQALKRPTFTDEAWSGMEPVAKQRFLSSLLQQIGEYANGSAAAGGFDRPDANISRLGLKLDEKGWKELAAASKKWLADVQRIEEKARKRNEGVPPHDLMDVGVVILVFEALALSDAPPPKRSAGARQGARV